MNFLPEIKQQIHRDQFQSVERFLELARDAESVLTSERAWVPPPAPEVCILPEAAFKNGNKFTSTSAIKKSSVETPKTAASEQVNDKLLGALSTMLGKLDDFAKADS